MPLVLSEMSLEAALRSYSSVKGDRTRVEREIGNLFRLLSATYSSPSEIRLNESLEKLQKHTHRLSDIAEYLASLKYAKARDHIEEVEDFKEILNPRYLRCSMIVMRLETPSQFRLLLLHILGLRRLNLLLLSKNPRN